jgi:tRNA threonylcarbamoyladenosine biosynthesis protein TsaE
MSKEKSYHIQSLDDLPRVAKEFIEDFGHRKVFAFDAPMGAGKTTFILSVLHAMGIEDAEGSPTYSLVNVYDSPMYGKVYHFDVYRLQSEEEAYDIGIEEMLYSDGICLIEWPEKIESLLPDNTIWSYISRNDDNTRTLTVHA